MKNLISLLFLLVAFNLFGAIGLRESQFTMDIKPSTNLTQFANRSGLANTMSNRLHIVGTVLPPQVGVEPQFLTGEPQVRYDSATDTFRMFYSGGSTACRIFTATSPDGSNWTKHATAVIGNGAGGAAAKAGRGSLFYEGGSNFVFYSDLTRDPGGDIYLSTSTDGTNFVASGAGVIFTGTGNNYANSRIIKEGSTYYLYLEGYANTGWRIYLYSATNLRGPWTALNGGANLSSMSISGNSVAQESESGGPLQMAGDYYHAFMWDSSVSVYGNDKSRIFYTRSPDRINWTKPQLVMDPSLQTIQGVALSQLADVWMTEARGRLYLYYSKVQVTDGTKPGAEIALATFPGSLAELVDDYGNADRIGQVNVITNTPSDKQTLVYGHSNRMWNFTDTFSAVTKAMPTNTATVTGTLTPSGTTGTYTYNQVNGYYLISGSRSLLRVGPGRTWEIRDASNLPIHRGNGASEWDPTGTYTINLNGSTGSPTISVTKFETNRGVYIGGFEPNYKAPRGSIHIQTNWSAINGTNSSFWFLEYDASDVWSQPITITNGIIQGRLGSLQGVTNFIVAGNTDGNIRSAIGNSNTAGVSRRVDLQIGTAYPGVTESIFMGVDQANASYKSYLDNRSGGAFGFEASGTRIATLSTGGVLTNKGLHMDTATKLFIQSGGGQRAGNAVLSGGTITVANTSVTAQTVIILTRKIAGGTIGDLTYTISAGTSFTINSASGTDTSTVSYFMVEVP